MSKTTGPFPPVDALETREAFAEAIVAVKVDPADLVPRFVEPPPAVTAPVITDPEAAAKEMARFDTAAPMGHIPFDAKDDRGPIGPVQHFDPSEADVFALRDRILTDDFEFHGTWHRAGCDANCDVPFGCAAQWHPEEIERLSHVKNNSPLHINRMVGSDRYNPAPLRPKTSAERKGEPIITGALRYFPDAFAAMARLSVAGNNKHNPGEPLHWARGKSMDQDDAAGRHIINPDLVDPETGETELVAAFWRLGALLQLQQERLLREKGILPYSGVTE